jgi:DNA-directed RNA polymerase subunit RPC12/RpoP
MPEKVLEKKVYRCPLCGNEFTEDKAERCAVCPLAKACNLILCPVCGYEFPKTSLKKDKKPKMK